MPLSAKPANVCQVFKTLCQRYLELDPNLGPAIIWLKYSDVLQFLNIAVVYGEAESIT